MSEPSRPPDHLPALDGVRGVAILAVIAFHAAAVVGPPAGRPLLGYGLWGVDLFFVLSGFLITRILLASRDSERYFRAFYERRTLRIFPAYYAFLAAVFLVGNHARELRSAVNPWWYVAYLQNWRPGYGAWDPGLQHLWSLAVEEQFYLVWPLLVWLCPPRHLGRLCLGLAALGPASRAALAASGCDIEAVHRLTPCQLDPLLLGGWLAAAERVGRLRAAVLRWWPAAALASLVALACLHGLPATPSTFGHQRTAFAVLFAACLGSVAFGGSRWLAGGWLRAAGRYSYAGYLFHGAVLTRTAPLGRRLSGWHPAGWVAWLALVVALTGLLAWVSWWTVELPGRRLKRWTRY